MVVSSIFSNNGLALAIGVPTSIKTADSSQFSMVTIPLLLSSVSFNWKIFLILAALLGR